MSNKLKLSSILRPALVLLVVFLIFGIGGIGYQATRTIQQLNGIEADRDRWQRPDDIIRALNLKDGNTVVDLGSGAGYFALRLSGAVGPKGAVLAVDLRQISLFFLRVRALIRWKNNIRVIAGEPSDPHLTGSAVDAVLIANTYHELSDPQSILHHISLALRPGGRFVIVDRWPSPGEDHHHANPKGVAADLRKAGFNVVSQEDSFIHQPGDELWWLIAASKP